MAKDLDRRIGKWRIIETSAWDRAHLDLVGPAYIAVDANGYPSAEAFNYPQVVATEIRIGATGLPGLTPM